MSGSTQLPVRPSSAVLGLGAATAVLLPRLPASLVAATAYSTAQAVEGDVIELMSVSGVGRSEELGNAVRTATGTLSWVGAHVILLPVLRRIPLPKTLVAVVSGLAVTRLNEVLMDKVGEAKVMAAEMAERA